MLPPDEVSSEQIEDTMAMLSELGINVVESEEGEDAAAETELADGRAIITLPGNPVSAMVSFEVFIRPALRTAMGLPQPRRPRRTAVLTEALTSPDGKRQFRRGVYDPAAATVTGYGPPASHHLRWLASANCLLDIGADVTGIAAGEHITVWDLTT